MKLGLKKSIPMLLPNSSISPHKHESETTTSGDPLFSKHRTGLWDLITEGTKEKIEFMNES